MRIKIYQINSERDERHVKFRNFTDTKRFQRSQDIDASIYDRVFMGDVDCENLEDVFHLFNTEGHRLHRGHSLSVSDIVEVEDGSYSGFHFCDSIGFESVAFKAEQAQVQENLIRVLAVEPGRTPYESEIPNTLEGQQRAVEGRIEYLYNEDQTIFVVNEENKINGSEGSRRIEGDIICGCFFVAGDDGENLCSLTEEQMQKYAEQFAELEEIPQEEIEAHTGFTLYPW